MVLVCMTNKTAEDVLYIQQNYRPRGGGKRGNIFELCDKFGVNTTTIYKILNGK